MIYRFFSPARRRLRPRRCTRQGPHPAAQPTRAGLYSFTAGCTRTPPWRLHASSKPPSTNAIPKLRSMVRLRKKRLPLVARVQPRISPAASVSILRGWWIRRAVRTGRATPPGAAGGHAQRPPGRIGRTSQPGARAPYLWRCKPLYARHLRVTTAPWHRFVPRICKGNFLVLPLHSL